MPPQCCRPLEGVLPRMLITNMACGTLEKGKHSVSKTVNSNTFCIDASYLYCKYIYMSIYTVYIENWTILYRLCRHVQIPIPTPTRFWQSSQVRFPVSTWVFSVNWDGHCRHGSIGGCCDFGSVIAILSFSCSDYTPCPWASLDANGAPVPGSLM